MDKDILIAKKMIEENQIPNNMKYGRIYQFSNENICGILDNVDIKDKNVLTVGSSGGQYFNFRLNGASNVDLFDISIYSKYFIYLCIAAITCLDYEEFLDFFLPKKRSLPFMNNKFFNINTYIKIRDGINDQESLQIWDDLFWQYDNKTLYYSNLFFSTDMDRETIIKCNDYLKNEENYNKLANILKENNKINFYNVDIINQKIKPNNQYDFIYLSNILEKILTYDKKAYLDIIKKVVANMSEILKDTGQIGLCYLYCYQDEYWSTMEEITLTSLYQNFELNEIDYDLKPFNGSMDPSSSLRKNKDALMLVKKKKN